MKKYKIGEISKMLDIPIQTIRFYEEHGIVQPQKDADTGYRYYDAWDVNNLIDCLYMRGLDFSLSQTEKMINSKDMDDICRQYIKQEDLLIKRIERDRTILNVLSHQRVQIQRFQANAGKIRKVKNPALLYHRYRNGGAFESITGSQEPSEMSSEMKEWLDLIPEVTPTLMIQFDSFIEYDIKNTHLWWGWSIPVEQAIQKGISTEFPNEYLPPTQSVYTFFEAEVRGNMKQAYHDQVISRILAEGYEINGNPIGRLITRTHENDIHKIYMETWVPVI